jgi:drug/metabolite transporter (DMT)-like permease
MKPMTLAGIVLIILGGLALAYQGFTYNHREPVMDVGPMHVTREDHERVSIPPILGGLALLGGVVLLAVGAKKNS